MSTGKKENCPQRGDYQEGWTENYQGWAGATEAQLYREED